MAYKVAFLSPVSYFKGGAERSLFDIMSNPDVDPLLIVPREGPVSESASARGIPFEVVDFGQVAEIRRPIAVSGVVAAVGDWFAAARKLTQIVRRKKVQIVHSNGLKAHCISGLSSRHGGAPCVFHIRDIAVRSSEFMIWKFLARASDHTILVSRACWPGQKLPGNVSVVFNAVQPGSVAIPRRENRGGGQLVLGICGRIHPFKGHHVALQWLHAARSQGDNITMLIRGEATAEDQQYVLSLQESVTNLGLENAVRFEGSFEGLAAIYGGLDAVLVPSNTPDPLPRSVMEAMSLGLPVIGYPAGGIVEMIDHGYNGWLADDAESFCASVRHIAELGPQLNEFQQRAAVTVAQRFGMSRMHRQIGEIYANVLK